MILNIQIKSDATCQRWYGAQHIPANRFGALRSSQLPTTDDPPAHFITS